MGHRALTRQKRKCRPARQRSMTMLTMQVRAMTSCTGRSMTRKGKATMAPPMPLTPDTKPPAIQARNTQISVIPGIRPSCGHGPPPSVHEIETPLPLRPVRRQRETRMADGGRSVPPAGKSPVRRGMPCPMALPAPQDAACRAGRLSCGTAFSHQGDCLRELPAPRSPARVHSPPLRPAHSMLRRVPAFWQPGTRGKNRKKPLTRLHQGLICHGGSCGVRTCDSLLKRQILYLLS